MLPRRPGANIPAPAEDLHNKNPSLVALGKKNVSDMFNHLLASVGTHWHLSAKSFGTHRFADTRGRPQTKPWTDPRRLPHNPQRTTPRSQDDHPWADLANLWVDLEPPPLCFASLRFAFVFCFFVFVVFGFLLFLFVFVFVFVFLFFVKGHRIVKII